MDNFKILYKNNDISISEILGFDKLKDYSLFKHRTLLQNIVDKIEMRKNIKQFKEILND